MAPIRAAGVVLMRRARGGVQLCLVHRPRQNDWSLPKGKADGGELMPETARREALEETGFDVLLGAPLTQQRYQVDGGPKTVDYWVAQVRPGGPGFKPNREVDRIDWVPLAKARSRLTYPRDRQLVLEGVSMPHSSPLIMLRHTQAVKRSDFSGSKDTRRPLTKAGRAQARALVPLLDAFGVVAVHSSDSKRCMQSVAPFAAARATHINEEPLLSEELFDRRPKVSLRRLRVLAARPKATLICTHRPVLPEALATLAQEFGLKPRMAALRAPLDPGALVILHRELGPRGRLTGRVLAVERFDP